LIRSCPAARGVGELIDHNLSRDNEKIRKTLLLLIRLISSTAETSLLDFQVSFQILRSVKMSDQPEADSELTVTVAPPDGSVFVDPEFSK
jgi:hypothetical protein